MYLSASEWRVSGKLSGCISDRNLHCKTEYQSKRNPTGNPRRARQTAKVLSIFYQTCILIRQLTLS